MIGLPLTSHVQGVAKMVRLRGGVGRITMPILFNLLEWYLLCVLPTDEIDRKLIFAGLSGCIHWT